MSRVEEKKQQKKKALMNSAYDLFTTVGFHKTTIMAIALRAGVAKGTFYLWFKDKEDIRNALIIAKSSELLTDALAELEHAPREMSPLDKLIYIVDYVITCLSRDIALLRFIAKNLSWGLFTRSNLYQPADENSAPLSFRDFIRQLLEEDNVQPTREMELAIFTTIELVGSTCYSVILNGEPVTLSEYKPYLFRCIRRLFDPE